MEKDTMVKAYRVCQDKNGIPYMREDGCCAADRTERYDSADKIAAIGRELGLSEMGDEYAYIVALNTKRKVTGIMEISHGSIMGTQLPIREILQKALLLGAVSFVLMHNHPTGDPTPSSIDIESTKKIAEGAKTIGIRLDDHVIVGRENMYAPPYIEYTSMHEKGLM